MFIQGEGNIPMTAAELTELERLGNELVEHRRESKISLRWVIGIVITVALAGGGFLLSSSRSWGALEQRVDGNERRLATVEAAGATPIQRDIATIKTILESNGVSLRDIELRLRTLERR